MSNYTTIERKIEEKFINFSEKMTIGLGKPDTKFMCDVLTGIIRNKSVILSDIARTSSNMQNILLKKGVERLGNHLGTFSNIEPIIDSNYSNIVKEYIHPDHLYFIDGGDIAKDDKTTFENKGNIVDGSKGHLLAKGYKIFEIDTVDKLNQPISLISDLMSTNDKVTEANKELSENSEWIKRMKIVKNTYGIGTFVGDRGFDGAIFMQNIIEMGCDFIIRANHTNRSVYVNNEKTSIENIKSKLKGKFNFNTFYKEKEQHLKVSFKQVIIKNRDAKDLEKSPLTIIVIKGFYDKDDASMTLITNKKITCKKDVMKIVRSYLSRWKIEQNFKFKKQEYKLEEIKVLRYGRIVAMNKLLSMALIFNNIINEDIETTVVKNEVRQIRKRVSFWLARVSDGLAIKIRFFANQIVKKLYPKPQPRRRDLWTTCDIAFRPY